MEILTQWIASINDVLWTYILVAIHCVRISIKLFFVKFEIEFVFLEQRGNQSETYEVGQ